LNNIFQIEVYRLVYGCMKFVYLCVLQEWYFFYSALNKSMRSKWS